MESYRFAGDMYFTLGEVKLAETHYAKQLSLVKEMIAADPADAQLLSNEAVALIKAGDVDAAECPREPSPALRIREQLSAAAPSDVYLLRDLDEALMKVRSVDGTSS